MDEGNLQQLARAERRQNRWEPLGKHRFSRARRPVQQKIVAPCGSDLKSALGAFLALDIAKVWLGSSLGLDPWARSCHDLGALKMIGELNEGERR